MKTDYASLLNENQLKAVTTSSQYVRIIAGAGSGKTRVLTYRIAYLIDEMCVDPSSILAVTFTNKAASEMKTRVAKLVPGDSSFLSVSTFHSFCARFLRSECRIIGYPVSFVIFDEDDQNALIKEVGVEMGYKKSDKKIKAFGDYIKKMKARGKYPGDITPNSYRPDEKENLEAFEKYEEKKMSMFAFDFDDLLLQTIEILKLSEPIRNKWSYRFSHILIDEYQDTNDSQHDLISLLSTPTTNLYVVGDPDQTIYSWRGANQNIILNFPKEHPGTEDIILNRNYRSTKSILDSANKLIANNKKRVPKDLFTMEDEGENVVYRKFDYDKGEASFVAAKIKMLVSNNNDYRNIAVLYRSAYMTRAFETEFAYRGIPYRIFGGLRFYQRKEVKDVLAYFRLLLNPLDDISFLRIVNVPKRNIGDVTVERLKEEAASLKLSCYDYVKDLSNHHETSLPPRAINSLSALVAKMEEVKDKLKEDYETYSSILRQFIIDIGYLTFLTETEDVDEDRVGNVNSLFDDITYFISSNPESTFEEYLQNVTLLTSQDDMNGGNYVSLMTIHVAKGLEFDNVFVISMNDGAFPNMRSVMENGNEGLEEERRLAYVALTRAKKRLFLSCNEGYSYTTGSKQMESRFFKEAGFIFKNNSGYNYENNGFSQRETRRNSFFSDGDAISPFEERKPKEAPKPVRPTNGISNWKVGDRVHHELFGDGTVNALVNDKLFVVRFDSGVEKTLFSDHNAITRIKSVGGDA